MSRKKITMKLEPKEIIEKVSNYYGYRPELLKSKRGRQELVKARQITTYFLREYTTLIQKDIAPLVGLCNRCTTVHSVQTVVNEYSTNRDYRKEIDEIRCGLLKIDPVKLPYHFKLMRTLGKEMLIQS